LYLRQELYSKALNITLHFQFISLPIVTSRNCFLRLLLKSPHSIVHSVGPQDIVFISAGMAHRAYGDLDACVRHLESYANLTKEIALRAFSTTYRTTTFRRAENPKTRVGNPIFHFLYYFKELELFAHIPSNAKVLFFDTSQAFLTVMKNAHKGIHPPANHVDLMLEWWLQKLSIQVGYNFTSRNQLAKPAGECYQRPNSTRPRTNCSAFKIS